MMAALGSGAGRLVQFARSTVSLGVWRHSSAAALAQSAAPETQDNRNGLSLRVLARPSDSIRCWRNYGESLRCIMRAAEKIVGAPLPSQLATIREEMTPSAGQDQQTEGQLSSTRLSEC